VKTFVTKKMNNGGLVGSILINWKGRQARLFWFWSCQYSTRVY